MLLGDPARILVGEEAVDIWACAASDETTVRGASGAGIAAKPPL